MSFRCSGEQRGVFRIERRDAGSEILPFTTSIAVGELSRGAIRLEGVAPAKGVIDLVAGTAHVELELRRARR